MRPVHKIKPNKRSIVAWTWCGVEPYRRGVESADAHNKGVATCKACLRLEAEAAKTAKVRRPIKVTRMTRGAAPVQSPLAKTIDALIEGFGIEAVLEEVRGYAYGRIDGFGTAWETVYETLVDTTRKVQEVLDAKKVTDWRLENEPT